MNWRGKEGDLALVIWDTPTCRSNVGRVVEVAGPLEFSTMLQMHTWLVRPVRPDLFAMEYRGGIFRYEVVTWETKAEHPDAWLLPIVTDQDQKVAIEALDCQLPNRSAIHVQASEAACSEEMTP